MHIRGAACGDPPLVDQVDYGLPVRDPRVRQRVRVRPLSGDEVPLQCCYLRGIAGGRFSSQPLKFSDGDS
jgi:hypothetical protein